MIKDAELLSPKNPLEDLPPSFDEAITGGNNALPVYNNNSAGPSSSSNIFIRSEPEFSGSAQTDPSQIFELGGPPPEFSEWVAEFSTTSSGNIVSAFLRL